MDAALAHPFARLRSSTRGLPAVSPAFTSTRACRLFGVRPSRLFPSPSSSPPLRAARRSKLISSPRAAMAAARAAQGAAGKALVVVGSANADVYVEVPRLPLPGETISATSGATLPGGKGANQAAAGARLGHPTYLIGQVGSDGNGGMLTAALSAAGVRVDHVTVLGGSSATAHSSPVTSAHPSVVAANNAKAEAEAALAQAHAASQRAQQAAATATREANAAGAAHIRPSAASAAAATAQAEAEAAAAAQRAASAAARAAAEAAAAADGHSEAAARGAAAAAAASMAGGGEGSVPTGTAIVMLQANGNNSIIIVGGANMAWSKKKVGRREWYLSETAREAIKGAGMVLLQRELPDDVNAEAAEVAAAAGVAVVLDMGGMDRALPDTLLQRLAVLSPNETELARLTGLPVTSLPEAERAAHTLLAKGVPKVLVKLGSSGSLLVSSSPLAPPSSSSPLAATLTTATDSAGRHVWQLRQPVVPVRTVVDTTGAGDTFTAAFAVALLSGSSDADALLFASCAASLCVQKKGAMPSLPDRAAVQSLVQQSQTSW